MPHYEDNFERIEAYLNGALQGDDLSNFEQQLTNNTELRNEFALHREVESLLIENEIDTLRQYTIQLIANKKKQQFCCN